MQDNLRINQGFTASLPLPPVPLAAPAAAGRIRSTSWRACGQRG